MSFDKVVSAGLKMDLHIHSAASSHKDKEKVKDGVLTNLGILTGRLNEKGVQVCAITDHDTFDFNLYSDLKKAESDSNSSLELVLPGVEFSVKFDGDKGNKAVLHVIAIFNDKDEGKVKRIEEILPPNAKPDYDCIVEEAYTEKKFLEILKKIDLDVIMIVHQKGSLRTTGNARAHDANSVGVDRFNEFLATEYFEAYEFRNKEHELFDRKYIAENKVEDNLRLVTGSDCHNWSVYPGIDTKNKTEYPFTYVKCLPTFRGLVMAMTDNRRIKLVNSFFNPAEKSLDAIALTVGETRYNIPLSKGVNAIIGDNSVGKSLLMHALTGYIKLEQGQRHKGMKTGYEKYQKEHGIVIETKIDTDSLFQFDMQHSIKEMFEQIDDKSSSQILESHFPEPVNAGEYRNLVEVALAGYFNELKKWVSYNEERNSLKDIIFPENVESPESITFLVDSLASPDSSKLNALVSDIKIEETNLSELIKRHRQLLSNEDIAVINEFIAKLQELHERFEAEAKNITYKQKRVNTIKTFIKKYDRDHKKVLKDSQKIITGFFEDKQFIINAIVELKKIQRDLKAPTIDFADVGVAVNTNNVSHYTFVSRLVIERVTKDYVLQQVKRLLKNGMAINPNSETHKTLEDKIAYYPQEGGEVFEVINGKIAKNLDNDFKSKRTIVKDGQDIYGELSSGVNAQIYFSLLADISKNSGIYIIDQPEDQISQNAIGKSVLSEFRYIGEKRQVLLVTHNPQFIVNLDVDNVIYLSIDDNGRFSIQSGALEYECPDYSVLDLVVENVEGGLDTVKRRFKRYEKAVLL